MVNNFKKNILFLRKNKALTQHEAATALGLKRTTIANYETGHTEPNIETILLFADFFKVTIDDLITEDLQNVALNEKGDVSKTGKNVALNVAPNVALTTKKQQNQDNFTISMISEPSAEYLAKSAVIPITDISVAAGSGVFNSDFVENVDSLRLPGPLIKRGATYLCVKIKGPSMSPTLQDAGYVIIRHLDRSEWAKMPDERIYVVSDNDGKSYLKRVKNRFKQGFIVLKSDNPDQASFPNFNLTNEEINSIWYVEWYLSAKMPNIHDQYYSRLQRLEDIVDNLARKAK